MIDRFFTDLEHVVEDVFDRLVEQAAARGLLDVTYRIDLADVRPTPSKSDTSKCYDPTADEYYYGYTIVSTGSKSPIAATFTESKQASQETAMRVTRNALAVEHPIWILGDSGYDTLDWHDHLLAAEVVLAAPYKPRNTDEPLDIEYRVEDRVEQHNQDFQRKQSVLDETYNRRTGRTNDRVMQGLRPRGAAHPRPRPRTSAGVPCVVCSAHHLITNYEHGDNPGSMIITV